MNNLNLNNKFTTTFIVQERPIGCFLENPWYDHPDLLDYSDRQVAINHAKKESKSKVYEYRVIERRERIVY